MAKHKSNPLSVETQNEAMAFANKVKKSGQSKDQTKLIAAGIQKGIAEYKKSVKKKERQADKAKKKQQRAQDSKSEDLAETPPTSAKANTSLILLIASWCGFIAYYFISQ